MRNKLSWIIILVLGITNIRCSHQEKKITNSLGMSFVLVPEGSFEMGEMNKLDPKKLGGPVYLTQGDYDEQPVHKVEISKPFYMSVNEVTVEQFRKFRPSYKGVEKYYPYATGISWDDAVAFCNWLSKKEGKNYRLPTEAEWEYACRAGTTTPFYSGDTLNDADSVNSWGLKNMEDDVAEWVWDWYEKYSYSDQVDPVGPDHGFAKVVRGAGLDQQTAYYSRSANRAGISPEFPPIPLEKMHALVKDSSILLTKKTKADQNKLKVTEHYKNFYREDSNNQGNHNIGFRIVEAPMPETKPEHIQDPFVQQCVIQNDSFAKHGPDPDKPYFRRRNLLPVPPADGNIKDLKVIQTVGFDAGILRHNHSPSLVACPNGDLIAFYFTSVEETNPDVALIALRLRFGADQWDMPEMFLDFPDVDDASPLAWTDSDTLRLFWGANKLESGFPFQWISSIDNGATWSKVKFPIFTTLLGGYSAQPITSGFRDSKGYIHIACDAIGAESVLWESTDNGNTWLDPKGRTGGRHTTFALLNNGKILGMGGKSSDINGFMPESISDDGGRTWKIVKSPFPSLGSNQRPTIIKLQDGKLFFAGDLERKDGYQPKGYQEKGAYAALSGDNGKTWKMRIIPGVLNHEDSARAKEMRGGTLGYSIARQTPNGIIHLITSMNSPCVEFAFNEAWITSPVDDKFDEKGLNENVEIKVNNIKKYEEKYTDGKMKAVWYAGIGDNGRYLLNGKEVWYYPNGNKQWEVTFDKGKKVGLETYWDENGNKIWSWNYKKNGVGIWTHWYINGQKKSESKWKNKICIDTATSWNVNGEKVNQYELTDGIVAKKLDP